MPAGDIGGTKTNLALASVRGNTLQLAQMQSYESQRYDGLAAIVRLFLATHSAQVERACFGVAGPVLCGQATVTNLPWQLSEDELQQTLGIAHIALINDLTALAYAIPVLLPGDLVTLQAGNVEPTGATAILAPGTGLGEGYLWWDGQRYRPGASEGGHADFGPAGPLQTRLLEWLRAEYGHVSWERVLSGPGLLNIYRFLRTQGIPEAPKVAALMAESDPGAVIANHALAHTDALCDQPLDLFVPAMGAQAGNLALTFMATGGVYLGGGIPPKILPRLQGGPFLPAFHDKGRLQRILQHIPVYVIRNPNAALLGAAACALQT